MMSEKQELFTSLWDIIDFSAGYSLVVDSELKIKLINQSLAKEISDLDRNELIGKNWLDFVIDKDKQLVKYTKEKLD